MEDEDMEIEELYVVHEVDLDYEYDAPRYFDFTREESPAEAREVERWFESAKSYPPSPFAAKLFLRDDSLEKNDNISPHYGDLENAAVVLNSESDSSLAVYQAVQASTKDEMKGRKGVVGGVLGIMHSEGIEEVPTYCPPLHKGSRFCTHFSSEKVKTKAKNAVKSKSSTLMKPTASMLAKQNQPSQVTSSRFNVWPGQINERIARISGTESQAAKRQKLEGGHLCKAMEAKQPINLVHKVPKKDGIIEKTPHEKLRITIPREPDLETAQRAQRLRPKRNGEVDDSMGSVRRFKARPLNRKIFEAPQLPLSQKSTPRLPEFQLFHLKTSERAMQHISASSSSSMCRNEPDKELRNNDSHSAVENVNKRAGRISALDSSRQDGSQIFNFKAHPLNRKILSSKGDIGVFRNTKRGTTVPIEFNFHSGKTTQDDLPTELFSKLSLKSNVHQSNGSHSQPGYLPQLSCLSMKGSKENRFSSLTHKHEVAHYVKDKPSLNVLKQFKHANQEATSELGSRLSMRSLDIR